METKKGKTVFIEYSSSAKGQHFITVVQNVDHKRIIIGRIFREYDSEAKKSKYRATDFAGNQVFVDYKDLYAIKKQFIEHGQSLAQNVQLNANHVKQLGKIVSSQKAERSNELKNAREKKSTKEKTKEVSKTNPKAQTNPEQKEKEQDAKNPVKYKDNEQDAKENEQKLETTESEKQMQEETGNIEMSEREAELNQIREDNEDKEQDMEIDM